MYPELIHQMVLERTARFQRDAGSVPPGPGRPHIRPARSPWRTAIELRP